MYKLYYVYIQRQNNEMNQILFEKGKRKEREMGIDEGDTLVKNTLHVYMALPQ
jgi:hypothetical protein